LRKLSRDFYGRSADVVAQHLTVAMAEQEGVAGFEFLCLALYVAFWLQLENPYWAGTTAALVCQPHLGASLRRGWFRMIGTIVGGAAIVVLTKCFPKDRAGFLVDLASWGAACARGRREPRAVRGDYLVEQRGFKP
jgi:hypothetical protein